MVSGRSRSTTCLMPALTRAEDTPATPSARTAARRVGPDRRPRQAATPVHSQPWSPRALIALAAASSGGHAPQRLEQSVDPVVDDGDHGQRARRPERRRRGHGGGVPEGVGGGHAAPGVGVPSAAAARDGSPP